ncbi:MAG: phosphoribosyl-AMP cyclohydrolase [uncultured bacterium]|nr:MAG: phosphoribosyl-AMP cyclohydrolase [uncultured bacterium]
MKWVLNNIKFDDKGLVTAIIQDHKTSEVLMCAFMNKESLEITLKEKKCCYYSRSRKKLWLKGESSGNFQVVKDVIVDCDQDAILFKVEQTSGACHEGYRSCFFRSVGETDYKIVSEKLFDPNQVYKK